MRDAFEALACWLVAFALIGCLIVSIEMLGEFYGRLIG